MPAPLNHQAILSIFRNGSASDRVKFIQGCPPSPTRDQAALLARTDAPGARALALGLVGQGLVFGRDVGFGAEVAIASYDLTREEYQRHGPGVILPFSLSRAAYEALHALILAGRYEDALTFADQVLPECAEEPQNGDSIRVARLTALLELGRIDDLQSLLPAEQARGIAGPARIELDRIARRVAELVRDPRELPGASKHRVEATPELAERNRRDRELLDAITRFLAGEGGEMNESRVMQLIRDGTAVFTDPRRSHDPNHIAAAVPKLLAAREWSRANRSLPNENDALWGLYLCYSRLGRPEDAAVALQALRDNVETVRAGIVDPLKRGGVGSTYPFLFASLCKVLTEANRPLELLEAMEGAKGRSVADLLVRRTRRTVDERALAAAGLRVPDLMRRHRAHYLSFYVDDDATYAALVAKDGSVHAAPPGAIPLGRETLRAAARDVDPREWNMKVNDPLFGNVVQPLDERLSSLLAWLEPLVDDGTLSEGDHICYSPDEHLHHVPLHYLHVRGRSLADLFSVSRTHGASALELALSAPASLPARFVGIEVPALSNARDLAFLRNLHRAAAALADQLEGEHLSAEGATPGALRRMKLDHRIVHFATHGIFPIEGAPRDRNPYRGSGLLMSTAKGLPDDDRVARGELNEAILTPERILDMGLDFTGSHVTVQACVSGLAEEGLGGDALGLDWALTQAGAGSLLVSHWNVNVALSAEFFVRFYRNWLGEGLSKGSAWARTVRELRESGGSLAEPYCWAAFSLAGDWR